MKYNQQQYQLNTKDYNYVTNIWTLNIQNTEFGLNEAIQKIKKAKKQIKMSETKDELFAQIQKVLDFISNNNIASNNGYITVTNLSQHFLQLSNLPISAKKFSLLMTLILNNSEMNIFNIKRKYIKTGTVYVGIKPIDQNGN